jgi:hypothetical protein
MYFCENNIDDFGKKIIILFDLILGGKWWF